MHEKEVELGHPGVGINTPRSSKQQRADIMHIADTHNRRRASGVTVGVGSREQRELMLAN